MAVLSVECLQASPATSQKVPKEVVCQQRGRSASVPDRNGYPRPSVRPCPMPLTDMLPGMGGDFMPNGIPSGNAPSESPLKTPLTLTVNASMAALPGMACIHKLPLREFQESEQSGQRSGSGTPMPSFRQRSNSCTSLHGSSSGDTTRPNSVSRTGVASAETGISSESLRPLTQHERNQMKNEAVDWFRTSKTINNKCRSLEETEAILAAARERRSRGVKRCAKVEKVDEKVADCDVESVNSEESLPVPEALVESPQRRRSIVDPLLLWGAKATAEMKATVARKEQGFKKVQRNIQNRSHSIGGEGVRVGQKDSFLTRLRRRATTIE